MNYNWVIGQTGIVIEVLGAGILVLSARRTRERMRKHKVTIDHIDVAVEQILAEAQNQVNTHYWGFALLTVGLAMQFIGGFGQ